MLGETFFMFRIFLVIALIALPSISSAADNDSTRALHSLFDREWEYEMSHNPIAASTLGDRRWNDQWPNDSLAAKEEEFGHARHVLNDLHAIIRAQLSPEDQVSYDVFEFNTTDFLASEPYKWYLVRTNTFSGIQTVEGIVHSLRFETVKDYDDWIGRLHNFPRYMGQNIELMREGVKLHVVIAKVIAEKVLIQFDGMDYQDPTKNGFYTPFKNMPAGFPELEKQRLTSAAQQAIRTEVLPAFQRFRDFMRNEYLPASLPDAGIWQAHD